MTTSLFQPAFSIRWATSIGNLLTGLTSAQASPSPRTSRKSGDQPSSRAGSYSRAIPCRSKYAARRASRWLRKVTPPYSVMPRGDGVHL